MLGDLWLKWDIERILLGISRFSLLSLQIAGLQVRLTCEFRRVALRTVLHLYL